jgi:hypothetical protein
MTIDKARRLIDEFTEEAKQYLDRARDDVSDDEELPEYWSKQISSAANNLRTNLRAI